MPASAPPDRVRATVAGLTLLLLGLPTHAEARGDGFPDSFQDCKAMGGSIERRDSEVECRYSLDGMSDKGSDAWKECTDENSVEGGGFCGNISCSDEFSREIPSFSESLPDAPAAHIRALLSAIEGDGDRSAKEIIEIVAEDKSFTEELAEQLVSSSAARRGRALELTGVWAREWPYVVPTEIVDGLERITRGDVHDSRSDQRATALELLEQLHWGNAKGVDLSEEDLVAMAVDVLQRGEPEAKASALTVLGEVGNTAHGDRIRAYLDAPNPALHKAAWGAIRHTGDADDLTWIHRHFSELELASDRTSNALEQMAGDDAFAAFCPVLAHDLPDAFRDHMFHRFRFLEGFKAVPRDRASLARYREVCRSHGHPVESGP
ncbi:MAG: hypothetical protein ABEN55_11835 [Bradymonadaceae bacterium]